MQKSHSHTLAARPSTYRGKVHIDLPKVMYSRRLAFLNRVFYDVLGIQMTTVHHFGRLKCRKCCKVVQKWINSGPDFSSFAIETIDPSHASSGLVWLGAAWFGVVGLRNGTCIPRPNQDNGSLPKAKNSLKLLYYIIILLYYYIIILLYYYIIIFLYYYITIVDIVENPFRLLKCPFR